MFIIKSHTATKNASGSKLQYSVLCETKDISYFKLARMFQVVYTLCNQTYKLLQSLLLESSYTPVQYTVT